MFISLFFVGRRQNVVYGDGISIYRRKCTVVNQHYGADILMEYVIKGNSAVLKCSIPSFVADFVRVESWIDEQGNELVASDNYG